MKEGRLHLFGGFENKMLGITPNTELGHLYDWRNELVVLEKLGQEVSMKRQWLQYDEATNFWHFDLWGWRLERAKELFPIVTDMQFADDIQRFAHQK